MDPIFEAYQQINEGNALKKGDKVIFNATEGYMDFSDYDEQEKDAKKFNGKTGKVTGVTVENSKTDKSKNYYDVKFTGGDMGGISGIQLKKA